MTDVVIRWPAALDADVNTDYKIQSDEAASGTFADVATQNSTDRGDGSYVPFSTTLNGALTNTATTVVLTSGANFDEGDYILVDKEIILLGAKSTHTFSSCTRGVGGSIPRAHSDLTAVYGVHESYTDTVTYGSRMAVRHRVIRTQGSDLSVAAEAVSVLPTAPATRDLITVWGVVEALNGLPVSGVGIRVSLDEGDDYNQGLGVYISNASELTDETDSDGYWEVQLNRDVFHVGGGTYTIIIGSQEFEVTSLPDVNNVNYLEIVDITG
jgi:hypothetical protein